MVCSGFTGITTFGDWLVWPTGCNYYFYLVVIATVFIVLTLILYNREKQELGRADIISSLGVSSVSVIILSLIGTLIKNTANIPMIQKDIFLYILAMGMVFILIWLFKK